MLTTEDIQVVGTARDGLDALEKLPNLKPDIVTMDIEMPRMDGLTCLKKIMAENPLPVVMVSSLTTEGAKATFDALALGALDFIAKDKKLEATSGGNIFDIQKELQEKIRKLANSPKFKTFKHAQRSAPASATAASQPAATQPQRAKFTTSATASPNTIPTAPVADLIVLGCSTGGPKALQEFLPFLPKNLPVPMLIVQHMPSSFTKPFAERLNGICQLEVKEASNGDVPQPGHIYIAPGGIHMHVRFQLGHYLIELNPEPAGTLHRPSVDVLFQSAYDTCNTQLMAIILTGMGADGAQGMKKLKSKGAYTLAEAESSCVVYGMPKAAFELGCVDVVSPIQNMANILKQHFQV
jgi:two-component system chemotaxis response regulator CheB